MNQGRPHRMLWSYHYARRSNLETAFAGFDSPPIVFADSGGYSALTQGAAIDVGEYGAWLLEHQARFEVYANLDVIGDAEATWANQQLLEAKGLRPLPVFHFGTDMAYLDRYADAGHTYIALGGLVGGSTELLMPWLIQCFKWAQARVEAGKAQVVFHGFGLTSIPALHSLPWYTVDSTSWNSGARYATVRLFDPLTARWRTMQMFKHKSVLGAADLLRHYGFATDTFLDREIYHFSKVAMLAARSWRAFEEWCRRRHGLVAYADRPPGLHIYLADGSQWNHAAANKALTPGD